MPVREGIPCQAARLAARRVCSDVGLGLDGEGSVGRRATIQRRAMRVRHVLINGGPGG